MFGSIVHDAVFSRRTSLLNARYSGHDELMERSASSGGTPRDLIILLAQIADGNRPALATLYTRTSAKLYGICLRLMDSEQDAQDVLHDSFVTVWQKASRFDPERASAITWLAAVTRNKAIDRLRQRRRTTQQPEATHEIADDSPSALDIIEGDQDRERLADCLERLDERPRTLIRSAFFSGTTYQELAAQQGVPLGTMKSWIRRGLISLRGCLDV